MGEASTPGHQFFEHSNCPEFLGNYSTRQSLRSIEYLQYYAGKLCSLLEVLRGHEDLDLQMPEKLVFHYQRSLAGIDYRDVLDNQFGKESSVEVSQPGRMLRQ